MSCFDYGTQASQEKEGLRLNDNIRIGTYYVTCFPRPYGGGDRMDRIGNESGKLC